MHDQFFKTLYSIPSKKSSIFSYQRKAGFNRNEFDRSSHVSSLKSSSKKPTFFSSLFVGDIH
ncbi:hypothetical protein HZS_7295 [Henneguya salminicola]|nr:hypothetical protein HZS_7295 [Henneguya salminicola]